MILFSRDMNGWENEGIFEMNADGSNSRQLTSGYRDMQPTWSPDRTQIAFIRELRDSGTVLFVVNTDGSNATALTGGVAWDAHPAWSPDGKSIAFGIISASRMCYDEYDNFALYECGREVKRVGLDGAIISTWVLTSAFSPAWQR